MKTLAELQQSFAADLWNEGLHELQGLILDDQIPAARRFKVYLNNFQTSLTDALAAVYPVIEKLVGREFFYFLAESYVRAEPSRSGNLHDFGRALPRYLSDFEAAANLPYLADVARLEWAYHSVFHAAGSPLFANDMLTRFETKELPSVHFDLGPACRLVRSSYPVFRIWQVNQESFADGDTVNLDSGPESVLIVRPRREVELRLLNDAETALLGAIEAGASIGSAVDAMNAHAHECDLTALLAGYFLNGVVVVSND